MQRQSRLLVLPTVEEIGALIQSILTTFDLDVLLPAEREPPDVALERAREDVAGVMACCDHPLPVLRKLHRRAASSGLPMLLFSSRLRASDVSRVASELAMPWVDLTVPPERIAAVVNDVIKG